MLFFVFDINNVIINRGMDRIFILKKINVFNVYKEKKLIWW